MKTLKRSQIKHVSGGVASLSAEGLLVTGDSSMNLNGIAFDAAGHLFNAFSGEIYFDFFKQEGAFCYQGTLYTATAVEGGYLYNWTTGC